MGRSRTACRGASEGGVSEVSETELETQEEETGEAEEEAEEEAEAEGQPVELPEGFNPEALEREITRHGNAMKKVMGSAFPDMALCPTCEGMGWTPEQVQPPPELADDPLTERCAPCRGLGLVKTGSLREGQDVRSCVNCSGNGYTTKAVQLPSPPQPIVTTGGYVQPNGEPLPAHLPPGTLDQLRAAGFVVVPPPPGGQSIAP